ncbi:hypothetical protein [Azohydromonas aeria]|uniref:hypothetical protein n=1 Tax=Azohydromonas aeria TaxID=2590212 RepID=UPI0012F70B82|nr:hypothetical protein [Azohydromonas aeria]
MSEQRVSALLSRAVNPSALNVIGPLTSPRSWGVYEVSPASPSATRRFRNGNHPVRQRELEREFKGAVRQVALFTSKSLAEELSGLLNAAR